MKKKTMILGIACGIAAAAITAGGLGFVVTPEMKEPPNQPVDGIRPFHASAGTGSNYYRIPAMITAQDGTVVAAMDARFGGTHDSPNNLDTAVSLSRDNGLSWSDSQLVFSFDDYEDSRTLLKANGNLSTKNSASIIDPSLLQDEQTGRILMLVDVFPFGTGSASAQKGNGYTEINGEKVLLLQKDGEKEARYTVRPDGAIYDVEGNRTAYSLNSRYEILENGQPLMVRQKRNIYWYNFSFGVKTQTRVPMNIMYEDALFHPMKTSYLYLMYSDDSGSTWSDPIDLNAQVKSEDTAFLGVCPGRGLQLECGEHAGRLLFPVYTLDSETGEQRFSTIYSDDHGSTWHAGKQVEPGDEVGSMSETQLVQLPDGRIQSFSRTTAGRAASSISTDGGVTWGETGLVEELPLSGGSGCQLSAIRYQGTIDGKEAVLLSAPAGDGRKNGYIYVGLISEPDGEEASRIEWTYKREITGPDVYFAYSCLTQLADGRIGLLYEQANTPQTVDTVVFEAFTVEQLCK